MHWVVAAVPVASPDPDLPCDGGETKFTCKFTHNPRAPLTNKPKAKTTLSIRLSYLHSSCIYPHILFKTLTNSSDPRGKKNPEKILWRALVKNKERSNIFFGTSLTSSLVKSQAEACHQWMKSCRRIYLSQDE